MATALLAAAPLAAQVTDSTRAPAVEVEPITVTTTRTAEPLERLPAAVTVLDAGTLGTGPFDGVEGLLGAVPGVFVANRYNFSLDQRLSIRGFGSRANFGSRGVRVLLDGVPQTLPDGQTQFTNVDYADLARVEVLRGAASALHGNASGGVVALRSRGADPAPFAQSAEVEAGAFETLRWRSRSSARRERWSAVVIVSRLTTDGFREHSAADQRQASGSLEVAVAPGTVGTLRLALADHPRADNPGALTEAELAADPRAAAPNNVANTAGKAVTQQQLSLELRRRGEMGEYGAVAYTLWRDLDNPLATGIRIGLERAVLGARLDASRRLGARAAVRLTGGLDVQTMRDDRRNRSAAGSLLVDQRERVSELGPFLQLDWSPHPRLLLEGGARYDRTEFDVEDELLSDGDDGGRRVLAAWSGRGGASVELSRAVRGYLSVSTAFETPTTTELGNRPDGSAGINPELGPQRATSFELGARSVRGPVTWSASLFSAWVRDAITQFEEIGGRAFFRNAGRVRQRGAEAAATVRLVPAWSVALAYTLADYRFTDYGADGATFDGNRLPGVPLHALRSTLRVVRGDWAAEVEHALTSSLWADDANSIAAAGWGAGVVSLRLSGTLGTGALAFVPFSELRNVTGKSHVGAVTINGFNGRVFEPAPRRHLFLGLRAHYAAKRE
ncbi:MAG TPA: TonB-dependent receptor [Gemmatimonadales bacterium]|nr:TonB-dependent receptor [Gemmatimonadales bacterium]